MMSFGGKQTHPQLQLTQILQSLNLTTIDQLCKHHHQLIFQIKNPHHFKTLIDILSLNQSKSNSFSALTLLNTYQSRDHFFSPQLFSYASSKIIENPIYFQYHPLRKIYKKFIQKLCCWRNITSWHPADFLQSNCQHQSKLKPTLDCLLGIAGAFEYRLQSEYLQWFQKLNSRILPVLVEKMMENCSKDPEILYLGFKYMQRISHCNLPKNLLQSLAYLIEIVKAIINAKQPYPLEQYNQRDTDGFYFFHTKKWVYKLLINIFKRSNILLGQSKKKGESNNQPISSSKWVKEYGKTLTQGMINDLKADYPSEVFFQLLRCIQKIQYNNSSFLVEERNTLQYEILIPMLAITAQEEEKMKTNPCQYNTELNEYIYSTKNIKRICEDVWIGFLKSPFVQNEAESLNFYSSLIQSENPIKIELAFRLMAKSPHHLGLNVFQLKEQLIISYLQSQIFALRAGAFSYISSFVQNSFIPHPTLIKLLQITYESLTKDTYIYVRLKASQALIKMAKKEQVHQMIKPIIYQCCLICLKLSEEFWIDHLVVQLKNLFKVFQDQLAPLAPDLFKQTERVFLQLLNSQKSMDKSQDLQSFDNIQFTLETLLEFQKDLVAVMPSNQLQIVEKTIIIYEEEILKKNLNLDIEMGGFLQLLGCFLRKSETIHERFWIYYDIFVSVENSQNQKNFFTSNSPQPKNLLDMYSTLTEYLPEYISCFTSFFPFLHQLSHNVYLQKLQNLLKFVRNYKVKDYDDERVIYLICGSIIENIVWFSVQMRNQFIFEIVQIIHQQKNKNLYIAYQYITTSILTSYPQMMSEIHKKNPTVYQKMISSIRVPIDKIVYPKLYVLGCLNLFFPNFIPVDVNTVQLVAKNVLKLMKEQNLQQIVATEEFYSVQSEQEGEHSMQMEEQDQIYIFTDYEVYHRSNNLDEKAQFVKTMEKVKKHYYQFYSQAFQNSEVEQIVEGIKEKNPFLMEFADLSVKEGANPQ